MNSPTSNTERPSSTSVSRGARPLEARGLQNRCVATVFAFAIGFWSHAAVAAPLTVNLSGGFTNQSFTFGPVNGDHDEITASATVNLTFSPSLPTSHCIKFTSLTAQISGTIRVWGTAKRVQSGNTTIDNFANAYDYSAGPGTSVPIHYKGQTGTGGILDFDWAATPYAIHYYGSSQVLRLWNALPQPFWYYVEDEFYDSTGRTTAG